MVKDYADKLSDLILTAGVNLRKGQNLHIVVGPSSYPYAQYMAKKAYEAGAGYVQITINDTSLAAKRSLQQSGEALSYVPNYLIEMDNVFIKEDWARVRIDSGEDRVETFDSNLDNLQKIQKAIKSANKPYSNLTMANKLSWTVCVVPGPRWAEQILGKGATEEELAAVLSKIMKFDSPSPIKAWEDFCTTNKKRSDYLNSLRIKALHYKSPITDLTIGLSEYARFNGANALLPDGRSFLPNLPTEEIFTTPDRLTANGYVTTTRPVTVLDNPTEEVTLYFKDGEVIDVKAKKGLDIMKKYLAIDSGSNRLGEVALVDVDSPISRSNLVFGSILVDENASCHLALGAGYPEGLSVGGELSEREREAKYGCNVSLVHTDFMVGDETLTIEAETYDGKSVLIMKNGRFTF